MDARPGRRPIRQPEDDSVDAPAHRSDRRGHIHARQRRADMDLVRPAPAPQEHHPVLQQAVPERRGDERSASGRMERDRRRGRHDHLRRRHRTGRGTQARAPGTGGGNAGTETAGTREPRLRKEGSPGRHGKRLNVDDPGHHRQSDAPGNACRDDLLGRRFQCIAIPSSRRTVEKSKGMPGARCSMCSMSFSSRST